MRVKKSAPFHTLRELTHHCARYAPNGKSMHEIAAELGQDYTQFVNALSGQERARLDADLVVPTLRLAGAREQAGTWCAAQFGGVFVDLEKIAATLRRSWKNGRVCDVAKLGLDAAKRFGDVAGKLHDALEDQSLTEQEADELSREIHSAVQALLVLDLTIEQAREKGEEA